MQEDSDLSTRGTAQSGYSGLTPRLSAPDQTFEEFFGYRPTVLEFQRVVFGEPRQPSQTDSDYLTYHLDENAPTRLLVVGPQQVGKTEFITSTAGALGMGLQTLSAKAFTRSGESLIDDIAPRDRMVLHVDELGEALSLHGFETVLDTIDTVSTHFQRQCSEVLVAGELQALSYSEGVFDDVFDRAEMLVYPRDDMVRPLVDDILTDRDCDTLPDWGDVQIPDGPLTAPGCMVWVDGALQAYRRGDYESVTAALNATADEHTFATQTVDEDGEPFPFTDDPF